MLKKFTVSNFKNFKDEISLDFSKIGEYSFNMDSLSMRLIYGRNATGKTNFGRALLNIKSLLCGMQSRGLINADSQEDTAKFIYEFQFGSDEVTYKYSRFANTELCDEELYINGEAIIKCDFKNSKLVLQELPDGQDELYFSHKKLVPFYSTASSGTLALTSLY